MTLEQQVEKGASYTTERLEEFITNMAEEIKTSGNPPFILKIMRSTRASAKKELVRRNKK